MQRTPLSRLLAVAAVLLLAAAAAPAEPYWITWEGNDYPENQGWQRITYGGGSHRWLGLGNMVIDGLVTPTGSSDFYRLDASMDIGPDEFFLMEWRLRVDEVPGWEDPGINMTSLDQAMLTIVYSADRFYILDEHIWIDIAPGVFHEYSLKSYDLVTYTLHIDGELAHTGQYTPAGWDSGVEWGDYGQSSRSLSTWDYVRFGIVPEPTGALLGLAALLVLLSSPGIRR
jgi:hypothetical protein